MELVFVDIETYYDKQHSLRKLTPPEYILGTQFEMICMGVAINDGPVEFVDGPDCAAWFASRDPAQTILVAHNALFDCSAIAWCYQFVPWQMVCTLAMARCLLGYKLRSLSLGAVAEHFGVGHKGDAIKNVTGLHRVDIKARGLWDDFKAYCLNDVDMLQKIFFKMQPDFPPKEWPVLDLTLRAAVEPRFTVDVPLLVEYLDKLRAAKEQLLQTVGSDRETIMGNGSFIKLLTDRGVDIKYKKGKKGPIPATAKTDDFMAELQEHDDPIVQALAAARLGFKSTLAETRTERFINIAGSFNTPLMPIALRYAGAHTHRFSGEWKVNAQNLPRGGVLRKALRAPAGYQVVMGDLSQIEARLVAWLSKSALLNAFRSGLDPYKGMALEIFRVPLDKVSPFQRFVGKAAVLGLGYGMGADKFYHSVIRNARAQGVDMTMLEGWTPALAQTAVDVYREINYNTKNFWYKLDACIRTRWRGNPNPVRLGPITISNRDGYGYIQGPTLLEMRYHNPRIVDGDLYYSWGGVPMKIYGAAALENICQHLAGVVLKGAMVRMAEHGYNMVHQVHDEAIFLAQVNEVDKVKDLLLTELTRRPFWAPDLPLAAEVKSGPAYG